MQKIIKYFGTSDMIPVGGGRMVTTIYVGMGCAMF